MHEMPVVVVCEDLKQLLKLVSFHILHSFISNNTEGGGGGESLVPASSESQGEGRCQTTP